MKLNYILRTSDTSLEILSAQKVLEISNFVHVDDVQNIYRRIDLTNEVSNNHFHTQTIILRSSEHLDKVSHMDVTLINSILRHRPVNFRYTIICNMLIIPNLITQSLLYGHFITRIFKYFKVPIMSHLVNPLRVQGMRPCLL